VPKNATPRRHKGGRKTKDDKREKMVRVRLTDEEFAELVWRAQRWLGRSDEEARDTAREALASPKRSARLGVSGYLRARGLDEHALIQRPGVTDRRAWAVLSGACSNLNQVARRLHTFDPALMNDLEGAVAELLEMRGMIDELMRELAAEVPAWIAPGSGEGPE